MRIFTLLILFAFTCFVFDSSAQTVTRDSATVRIKSHDLPRARIFNSWDIGAHAGLLFPNTDIAASDMNNSVSKPTLGYGLSIMKFLTHSFAIQGNFMRGTLKGDGAQSGSNVKYNYKTDINYQATVNAYFQIGNISFLKRNPNIAVFGSVGIGFIHFNPLAYRDGSNIAHNYFVQTGSTDSTTYSYKNTTEIVYPFGLGVKFRLSKMFSVQGLYTYNVTRSDKLDGFVRLLSENDNFNYFSLGLNIHLGTRPKMLEWHNPMYSIYADLYDTKDKVDLMTRDTDEDGVADIFDREPDTPKGNKVYGDGTSIDSDGDGVPDINDVEPFSAKNAKVDASGKEIDSDGDGIPDSEDMEPSTAKGSLVTKKGITIPIAKGKGGGSSVMATNGWLPSIFFELNSDEINVKYNETMATIALIMRNNPDVNLQIIGNCDFRSSYDYNIKLGKRRAEAVKKHLVRKYKIDARRLTIESLGKNDPITEQDHRMNRRVDFKVAE